MDIKLKRRTVPCDEQGFIHDPTEWDEEFAAALAAELHIDLYIDHWELIWYFRESYEENQVAPTMHQLVLTLGNQPNKRFLVNKSYEEHLYKLFPTDPIHTVSKLAGLPRPEPDT